MKYPKRIWLMDMGDCIAWCDEPDPNGDGLISHQYIKLSNSDINMLQSALRFSCILKNEKSPETKFLRRFNRILNKDKK